MNGPSSELINLKSEQTGCGKGGKEDHWRVAFPCPCPSVVADLARRHEEPERAPNAIGNGGHLRVHSTLRSTIQPATPPFQPQAGNRAICSSARKECSLRPLNFRSVKQPSVGTATKSMGPEPSQISGSNGMANPDVDRAA